MKFILQLVLCNLFIVNLAGQTSDLRVISLSTEEGLSNNTVVCMLQDAQGFMWFGTEDGLNRYDGYSFTVFRHNPDDPNSLVNNNISSIIQDETGDIWIGTKGGGLNRFNPRLQTFRYYLNKPGDSTSLCSNEVLSIYQDHSSQIWVGTDGGGISRYIREKDSFVNYSSGNSTGEGLTSNEILSICEDPHGNMWFGTWEGGLNYFSREKGIFEPFPLMAKEGFDRVAENIWAISASGRDQMWIGMWGGGFGLLNINEKEYQPLLFDANNAVGGVNNIWAVYQDKEGIIWVGTDLGLFRYFQESGEFQQFIYEEDHPEGISSNKVLCIYEDRDQAKWIGTDKGINVYFPNQKKFNNLYVANADGTFLSEDVVTAVLEDPEGITWIGTENSGLYKYIYRSNTLEHFENINESSSGISGGRINRLFIDTQENLWIGTRYGLSKYNRSGNSFSRFYFNPDRKSSANEVLDICEESDAALWVGTDDGLYQIDKRSGEFLGFYSNPQDSTSLNSNHILSLKIDNAGTLWVGSWKGINKFDRSRNSFDSYQHVFQDPNSLSNNYVHIIFQDRQGDMWFGTRGGLNRLDPVHDRFINFREKDGLPNDVINGILEDNHRNLWLSTNLGLSRFNMDSTSFKNFDQYDGIQGTQFSTGACFRNNSGTMFFGGSNGLSIFHPDSIYENDNVPDVWITGLNIGSEPAGVGQVGSPLDVHVSYSEQIVLSYKQKDLSFDFVALNYLAPSKNQYAYKLEGLSGNLDDWIYVSNRRTAYYTNIPPGEYTFRVKASNNDNLWNERGASLAIVIEPPFWNTTWFKILIIVSVYAFAYALFRLRMYRIKVQNRMLEAQVEERTKEVVQQKEDLAVQAENLRSANKSIISKNLQLEESGEKIRMQSEEIFRMNELLQRRNINLEENVHELEKARVMQKRVSFTEFKHIYPDIESCNRFLFELKESRGYECIKCGNTSNKTDHAQYSRRCTKCGYNESVTVGTIFYRVKFPIDKAFYILYLVSMGRELTVDELAGLISLRRETCWAFRNKVMEVMKKRKRFKNPREGWKELILVTPV